MYGQNQGGKLTDDFPLDGGALDAGEATRSEIGTTGHVQYQACELTGTNARTEKTIVHDNRMGRVDAFTRGAPSDARAILAPLITIHNP